MLLHLEKRVSMDTELHVNIIKIEVKFILNHSSQQLVTKTIGKLRCLDAQFQMICRCNLYVKNSVNNLDKSGFPCSSLNRCIRCDEWFGFSHLRQT